MSTYRKLGIKLATLCMLIAVIIALPKPLAADACTQACERADLQCLHSGEDPTVCFDNLQTCLASCP